MNETSLESILSEAFNREYAQLASGEQHKFSRRHKTRMRKVLSLDTNQHLHLTSAHKPSLKRRLILATIVILTAVILGITTTACITKGFTITPINGFARLRVANNLNSPKIIEEYYEPTWIPEGFKKNYETNYRTYHDVKYRLTDNKYFLFHQHTKGFAMYADNEKHYIEDININGNSGLIFYNDNDSMIFIDNGDYVLEVSGTIPKEILVKIAESVKLEKS